MDKVIFDIWSPMGLAVDLAIVVLLILAVVRGAKKGFVYGVIWLGALVAAVIAARFTADLLEKPIGDYFYEKAEIHIVETVKNATPDLNGIDWDQFDFSSEREEKLDDGEYALLMENKGMEELDRILEKLGVSQEERQIRFYSMARSIHETREDASDHLARATSQQAEKAIHLLMRVLILVITFLLVLVLVRFLGARISDLLHKIPLVGDMDRILGGAVNLLVFAALILITLFFWQHLAPDSFQPIKDSAPLTEIVSDNNPISSFFGD